MHHALLAMLVVSTVSCRTTDPKPDPDAKAVIGLVTPDAACDLDFCTYEGWCTDVGGFCAATTQAECNQSQRCTDSGCCRLEAGSCACD